MGSGEKKQVRKSTHGNNEGFQKEDQNCSQVHFASPLVHKMSQ